MYTYTSKNSILIRLACYVLILALLLTATIVPVMASDTSSASRRSQRLNSLEKYIYDELLKDVVQIAEGKRANAVITVDFSSKIDKTQFTAKDLGLSSLVDSSGHYTEDASSLALEKAIGSLDTDKIVSSLLRDAPYELYWFDKTRGCVQNVGFKSGGNSSKIGITEAKVDFLFVVSGEYSASGALNTYYISTTKAKSAATVLPKAKSIVAAASNKDDYDKLNYYREKICELASYNSSVASDPSKSALYGNPYQLIYVFDGISSTRVTCEGYSKAFKLLCDLTTFDSPQIACYLVSGAMRGGTGEGPHMWNVVRMDDGYNYMVDITNCDYDTIGYPNQLFLKGDSGGTQDKYAIGTIDGTVAYQYDSDTRWLFSSKERTIHVANYVKAQHVHQFGSWTYLNSLQHKRICKDDSSHTETAVHSWDSGKVTKAASKTSTGVMTYTCTVCKGTKTETIPKLTTTKIWYRLFGEGRYDTMRAIIDEGFTNTGGTVIVATGTGFKDALAASALAGLDKAPVVLTDGKSLSSQARTILLRLQPRKIYIAGGTSAVSDGVLSQIRTVTGVSPKRLFGNTSSGTSAALANEGKGRWKDNTAIIATNKSFKDALSVAPIAYAKGYPILLSDNGTSLSQDVLNSLKNIGAKQVIIVGGTGAVTTNVERQLRNAGISIKTRLAGNDGVLTSKAIAEWGLTNGMTANKMGVATSQNYPDALAGAALCGYNKSVLVLADDNAMTNASFPKLYKNNISQGYVFGGELAVGRKTFEALENSLK